MDKYSGNWQSRDRSVVAFTRIKFYLYPCKWSRFYYVRWISPGPRVKKINFKRIGQADSVSFFYAICFISLEIFKYWPKKRRLSYKMGNNQSREWILVLVQNDAQFYNVHV